MKDAEIVAVHTGKEMLAELGKEEGYALLIVHEDLQDPDAVEALGSLQGSHRGPILFCAKQNHPASFLNNLVRRLKVTAILQHPIDPDELVRRAAIEMAVKVPGIEEVAPQTHGVTPALAAVWRKHESTNLARVATLIEASELGLVELSEENRDTARRAAHQLAGSLGTFGLGQATLLAREAEEILRQGLDVSAAQQSRFAHLATTLELLIADPSARLPDPEEQGAQGSLLIYSEDQSWSGEFTVAARAAGWRVVATADPSGFRKLFALESPSAALVVLGDDEGSALILDLLGRGLPTRMVATVHSLSQVQLPASVTTLVKGEEFGPLIEALSQPAPTMGADLPTARILAVDDDPVVLETLAALLRGLNVELFPLEDPLQFWDKLEEVKPDILILDVDLPILGGIELCRAVRSDPAYACVPVLFLSAYNDAETVHRVFQAGGDDYIYKPVVGPELVTRVMNRLQRARAFEKAVVASLEEQEVRPVAEREGQRLDLALVVSDEVLAEWLVTQAHDLGRSVKRVQGSGESVLKELTGPLEHRARVLILEDADGLDFLRMLEAVGVPVHSRVWLLGELEHQEILVAYNSGASGYMPLGLPEARLRRWLEQTLADTSL
jgi:CheY-like chemotaxis protein/HPt (histidine-containing phosphotransfer) domain-containing protein